MKNIRMVISFIFLISISAEGAQDDKTTPEKQGPTNEDFVVINKQVMNASENTVATFEQIPPKAPANLDPVPLKDVKADAQKNHGTLLAELLVWGDPNEVNNVPASAIAIAESILNKETQTPYQQVYDDSNVNGGASEEPQGEGENEGNNEEAPAQENEEENSPSKKRGAKEEEKTSEGASKPKK